RVVDVDAALADDVRVRGEPGLADVEEWDDLGGAARDDVTREAAEGGRARASGVDDRRDSGMHAGQVGVDAGPVDPLEDVGVEVDQAGRDELAAHFEGPRRLGGGDLRRDARDDAVLHRDVENPVEPRRWIQHVAAPEHEIVHSWPPPPCALQAVAGLGPRRPRRGYEQGRARCRPSRGWGPAGRGAAMNKVDDAPDEPTSYTGALTSVRRAVRRR